jgi:hypothetical protein
MTECSMSCSYELAAQGAVSLHIKIYVACFTEIW